MLFDDLDYSCAFHCWSEFMRHNYMRYNLDLALDHMVDAVVEGAPYALMVPVYTNIRILREQMMDLEMYFANNLIDFDDAWLVNALMLF